MKLIQLSSGERYALSDLIYGFIDSPREGQSDITADIIAASGPRIISGFTCTFAGGTVSVSAGKALLTLKEGDDVKQNLVVTEDAGGQSFDCTGLVAGTYGVFVTFKSLPADLDDRSIFFSQDIGFERNQKVYTRLAASWGVVVAQASPGAHYTQIAVLSLPAGDVSDTRMLLFEGNAGTNFAPTWGTDADRSDDRGANPIADFETMIEALKVSISDIKGAPWYAKTGASGGGNGGSGYQGTGVTKGHGDPSDATAKAGSAYYNLDTNTFYIAE